LSKPSLSTLIDLPDELRGPRVLLRPYRANDAEAVFAAIKESGDHLRPWMGWVDRHATVAETRDYCVRSAAKWLLRSDLTLGIFDVRSGRYLGGTGFHEPDWALRAFEIGYWLRASAVGNGYITEAVGLLLDLAFAQLAARRVELRCDARNAPSRRVAERLGFVLEGCLRNALAAPDGDPADWLIYALIPEDWQRLKSADSTQLKPV
jgi:RimJ/RimL family protein N-acetyltransferase